MKRILFLLLFALCSLANQAQQNQKLESAHKQNKLLMEEQIKKLKNGVLLVRLSTKINSIEALKKNGNIERAEKIKLEQKKYNLEIIKAFRNNFTFCPVYFFYSNYSDNIKKGKLKEVVFLNDSLKEDSLIKLNDKKFLTAEIGNIEQDTAQYLDGYYNNQGENGVERRSSLYGGSALGFSAVKIMSDQLIQLKDPFPYYVKTSEALPVDRRLTKAITKMNNKLQNYFEKVSVH